MIYFYLSTLYNSVLCRCLVVITVKIAADYLTYFCFLPKGMTSWPKGLIDHLAILTVDYLFIAPTISAYRLLTSSIASISFAVVNHIDRIIYNSIKLFNIRFSKHGTTSSSQEADL